jgi:hypothetical protein
MILGNALPAVNRQRLTKREIFCMMARGCLTGRAQMVLKLRGWSVKKPEKNAVPAGGKPYLRRVGDRPGGDDRLVLEILTRGISAQVVTLPAGMTFEKIDAHIKASLETGLRLQLDDHRNIFMPAEMVKNSVFIVKSGH